MDDTEASISATLFIRRNADGIVRRAKEYFDYYGPFIWQDGNYACDCNRALFFARAAGEPDDDRQCGSAAFSVRLTDDGGAVLYEDGDWR